VKYREFEPHVSLREHVKCFWVMERESTREIPAEDVTPDPFIELIMSFGAPYHLRSEGGVEREMPKVFVVGLQEKPLRFRCDGSARLLATRFFAWGALPFLAEEGPGRLRTTLGREWNELAAKAASALVEEHLIGKLLTLTIDLPTIRAAAKRLHLRKGRFRMAELAECCDLSTRQVQRRFKEALGVSPKGLARAIRTDLAHEFEFTDQAHFIRDFKDFADRTPGELASEMRAIRDIFRDHEKVVFLQVPAAGDG